MFNTEDFKNKTQKIMKDINSFVALDLIQNNNSKQAREQLYNIEGLQRLSDNICATLKIADLNYLFFNWFLQIPKESQLEVIAQVNGASIYYVTLKLHNLYSFTEYCVKNCGLPEIKLKPFEEYVESREGDFIKLKAHNIFNECAEILLKIFHSELKTFANQPKGIKIRLNSNILEKEC